MTVIAVTNLQSAFPIPTKKMIAVAQQAASYLKLTQPNIDIIMVGKVRMRSIHRKFLNDDTITDVITFEHGEIVICPYVANSNAHHFKQPLADELVLYVIHGLLHLAGFDDHVPKDIKRMREMEKLLMDKFYRV